MKRLFVLWTVCSLAFCVPVFGGSGVFAAPVFGCSEVLAAPVEMESEIPSAVVDCLLQQFTDYVEYSVAQLHGFYQNGDLTIVPTGEAHWWTVSLAADGGVLTAILEDKF
jgi:hypothetical protein